MNRNSFLHIIIIFSLHNISLAYLVLPFKYLINKKSKVFNFNQISGNDFLEFSSNKLLTSLSVGTPYKTLDLLLTMDYKLFFIGKGYCQKDSKSSYEPFHSNSFTNNSFKPYAFDDLRDMTLGNDIISLYNDYNLRTNVSLNKAILYYGNKGGLEKNNKQNDKICGIMGFKLHSTEDSFYNKFKSLDYILKSNNITNHSFWSIEFFNEKEKGKNNNYDGYLILGAGDKKYLKDIKNIEPDEIQYSYSSHLSSSIEWMINFQTVFYYYPEDNVIKMNRDFTKVELNFDIDYYFSTKEYFESIKKNFFEKYINNGVCKMNKLKEFYLRYQFIICDKSLNDELSSTFPTLNFFSNYYNNTFQLTYKDLFMEVNNGLLFLMFYNPWTPKTFLFGKNFLKKYHFIFRTDQKIIGFLNYNQTNEDNYSKEKRKELINNRMKFEILLIIALSFLFIGIIIVVCFVKKKFDKKRKKRPNELVDEDYEYDFKNEAIND